MFRAVSPLLCVLLLNGGCAHSPGDSTVVQATGTGGSSAAAVAPVGEAVSAVPVVSIPAPPGEAPEAYLGLVGAWEGTWSDGAPSSFLVLEINAEYATVVLSTGGYDHPKHRPRKVRSRARLIQGGEVGLTWGGNHEPRFTFTLSPDGARLEGRFELEERRETVSLKRGTMPAEAKGILEARDFVCPGFAKTLEEIEGEKVSAARMARVDALMEQVRKSRTPIIEPTIRLGYGCVTFLYRGEAREVSVAGDINGWNPRADYLRRVEGTDLFFFSREMPQDARIDYKILPDGKWSLDPLNPSTMAGGFGPNSQFHLPRYVPPPEVERYLEIPHGTLEKVSIQSTALDNGRKVVVYLPPGYAESTERYRVLYVHDGQDALDFAKIDNILDYLIHHRKIPPVMAVLVPPVDRRAEYAMNPAFETFFVKELIPLIEGRYRTVAEPAGRAVAGISMGGLAALSLAVRYPEVFGGCIAQSTGGPDESFFALRELIRKAPKGQVRFFLDVGNFESDLHGSDLLDLNQKLREALSERGYFYRFLQVNEGHSWGSWRARLDEALEYLWR